ncbi:MAG: PIN domain nuclease [Balneolaceae bacterium]|nr:MAG: PIN domain nuclease [Balneolaceae bacterium]
MILVDTSVWIDYFNGVRNWQTDALDAALTEDWVLTGDIILAEVLQGFDRDADFHKARQALDTLECVRLGGKDMAIEAASHYRYLRSHGVTVRKTVDMLIAAYCIRTGTTLLHNDRDFERIAQQLPLRTVAPHTG